MYAALALLAITLLVNIAGMAAMRFATRKFEAER
jgi:phosphate transport system permease protein